MVAGIPLGIFEREHLKVFMTYSSESEKPLVWLTDWGRYPGHLFQALSDGFVEKNVKNWIYEAVKVSREDNVSAKHPVLFELSTDESYGIGPPANQKNYGNIISKY